MSVKVFSKEENKWIIFPGTIGAPGKDAYIIAQENGYQGTKEEYYNSLTVIPTVTNKIEDIENTIKNQVSADNDFLTEDRVIVSDGDNRKVKDSGILIGNLALKSYVDEKEISWDKITEKPETYTPSEHKHNISDINDFPEIPDPVQVDSELNSTSENPVQNKVVDAALKSKLDSTALDNYYDKDEIDSKISAAGGGDVVVSGELTSDNLIIGAGSKSIKDSGTKLSSLATKQEISTPTTFTWTDGTASGPIGTLSGDNMEPVTYSAIPSASKTVSGVVTTSDQSFSGEKTFERVVCEWGLTVKRHNEDDYPKINFVDGNFPYGTSYITPIKYTGISAQAEKVVNKLKFTGAVTAEYNGSSEVTVNIPEAGTGEVPIALPNPYPLIINAVANIPNGAVSDKICEYSGESSVTANINVAGYDECTYETGTPYLLKINGKSDYVLNGAGKWGVPHLGTTTTPGNYGICDKSAVSDSITISDSNLSEDKQVSILVTRGDVNVTFNNEKFKLSSDIANIQGNSSQYKCYCFQYINNNLILVNCSIYA